MSAPSVDSSLSTKLLPTVLSVIAGSVDVISFVGLGGLFTAHITGNLVILAAHVVSGGDAPLAAMLVGGEGEGVDQEAGAGGVHEVIDGGRTGISPCVLLRFLRSAAAQRARARRASSSPAA